MVSKLPRLAALILVVAGGCSSSGLFTSRSADDRKGAAGSFHSSHSLARGWQTSDRGRSSTSSKRSRGADDPTWRRQQVSEQLAAAAQFEKAGDTRAARVAYERVLDLEPAHTLANYQLAIIADNEKRFEEAQAHYRILLGQSPRNPDLLASIGWSYFLQGHYDDSERVLRDALAIDPRHPTALYNLGWLYGTLGDYDQALAIFRQAGSEDDAARAIAELFPHGRPADSREVPGAPRNPFRPRVDAFAGGNPTGTSGLADRGTSGPISAPAPWKRTTGDATLAHGPARLSAGTPAVTSTKVRSAGQFDDVFEQLESASDSRATSPEGSTAPPQKNLPAPELVDALPIEDGAVTTAGYDRPGAPPQVPPEPSINPKGAARSGDDLGVRAAGSRFADSSMDDWLRSSGRPLPGVPNPHPDWPYRSGGEAPRAATQTGAAPATSSVPSSARSAAAQLGFSVGAGGLLFPVPSNAPTAGGAALR